MYKQFKEGQKRVLVATDLIGRGIDIERVNIVINYDMPETDDRKGNGADTYLHRVSSEHLNDWMSEWMCDSISSLHSGPNAFQLHVAPLGTGPLFFEHLPSRAGWREVLQMVLSWQHMHIALWPPCAWLSCDQGAVPLDILSLLSGLPSPNPAGGLTDVPGRSPPEWLQCSQKNSHGALILNLTCGTG